ncbi:unnamed protein product [Polarella glacialis]|uniref:Uncharacterized protein n=1 Tax=Polarella glacialis TaxID=89957 RepID=A0A813ECG3_POLGL|nr:unnamed protein product [Polarella glacialis]
MSSNSSNSNNDNCSHFSLGTGFRGRSERCWLLLFWLSVAVVLICPFGCDKDQNGRWLGGRGLSLILALLCLLCFVCCFLLPVDLRGRHLGPIACEKGTMSPLFFSH